MEDTRSPGMPETNHERSQTGSNISLSHSSHGGLEDTTLCKSSSNDAVREDESKQSGSNISLSHSSHGGLEDTTSCKSSSNDALREADNEETGSTSSDSSRGGLWFRIDFCNTAMTEKQQDAEVTTSLSIHRDPKQYDLCCNERIHDTVDILDSPQKEKREYESIDEIRVEKSPPILSKDQPQEEGTGSSNKRHRRGWKGVRRRVTRLFFSLCCCLLTPETEDTFPR
ncbi:hypothetical protein NN561_017150 [Cricetulus griseus]